MLNLYSMCVIKQSQLIQFVSTTSSMIIYCFFRFNKIFSLTIIIIFLVEFSLIILCSLIDGDQLFWRVYGFNNLMQQSWQQMVTRWGDAFGSETKVRCHPQVSTIKYEFRNILYIVFRRYIHRYIVRNSKCVYTRQLYIIWNKCYN